MMPLRHLLERLALVATLLLAGTVHAQTRAWLDRDRIAIGETATLNIQTDQPDAPPPDYDVLASDFVASGHSSRRSVDIVNGRRRTTSLFAVALAPRREGVVTVPALRVGGESTQPLPLTVVPATATPARAGQPAFIESETDTASPYVQQTVGHVLRLYYATPLVSGELDQPAPEGASMQRVGSDLQYSRDIGGQRYTVVERRFQIVPERSGPLTIPGARFEGRGVGGFFDDVFGDGRRELRANGATRVLQVRPMPAGAPQPWLPLHGLELRYVSAPQAVRAGEAAAVVIEMVADGAVGTQLPELALAAGSGAQVFAEPPQVDESFDNGRLRSRVVRRFSVVPAREGTLRIPGPRMAWWDVRAATARTASLPDLQWVVDAGSDAGAPASPDATADGTQHAGRTRGAAWWPWLAGLFALLWLATLAWAWRMRRVPPRPASSPARDAGDAGAAGGTPRLTHRRFMQLLQAGGLDDITQALLAMAMPAARDLDDLASRLADASQRAALARLQQARWGGGDAGQARAALRDVFSAGPIWADGGTREPEMLPPLYPRRTP